MKSSGESNNNNTSPSFKPFKIYRPSRVSDLSNSTKSSFYFNYGAKKSIY